MQRRRDAALQRLWLILGVSIAAPIALFAYASWINYRAEFRLADERITHALDISAEQALRVFQSINVTFDSVEQIIRGKTDQSIQRSEAELSERLKQFSHALPDIASIWIMNNEGNSIVSSIFFPVPSAINNPDRDELKAQLAPGTTLHIGEVLKIKKTDRLIFPVSKRRADSSGTIAGFTEISVRPQAFETFYASLAAKTSASFALIRDDGSVLARYPIPATVGIKLDASTAFGQLIARSPNGGQYTTVSAVDQLERRFVVRKLDGFPLYVSSSLETNDILTEWIWKMAAHLVFGLPATACLVVLCLLAMRSTKELYAEAERREKLEASLRQSQKMDAIGQLTGGVAHDFNNLLTIILGNLQRALRQIAEGKTREMLVNALYGAERAAELTKRLLAFSRGTPLNPRPIDLNRLVTGMSALLGRTLGETTIIETVRGAGLWRTEADEAELEAVILNLAINGRDAMPNGGKLTIETANAFLDEQYCEHNEGLKPGQYVMVSVTDTGTGMTKEVIEKAFEPFFSTKAAGAGTGLGLSQAYGFVKQSGGHLRIYSEVGEGTTVRVYLPRSFAEASDEKDTAKFEMPTAGNREAILVVEDDNDVRKYVVDTLRSLNYEVVQASNGEDALVLLKQPLAIDLLLTDVVMPGINGRHLADAAVKFRPSLKVLYMTGYSRNAIVHQGRLDPGVSMIQKPFSQNALASRLRQILTSQ